MSCLYFFGATLFEFHEARIFVGEISQNTYFLTYPTSIIYLLVGFTTEAVMIRITLLILFCCSMAIAQTDWEGQDSIWQYSNGGPIQMIDPCFGPDSNSVLLTWPENDRIMRLDYLEADTLVRFLPESLSVEGYADAAPFLTIDGLSLYFSSNRPGGYGGYDIWVTHLVNEVWQMPVNLGPAINTARDETGPTLDSIESELFFCSASSDSLQSGFFGHIVRSRNVGGEWAAAEFLPYPVNTEYGERDPAISSDGQYLYFISGFPMNTLDRQAWVCQRSGDGWSERIFPGGFVNHIWQECAFMPEGNPFSVAIDRSGRRLLYTKEEVYECIDPESRVYMSHVSTGIDGEANNIPRKVSLSLYPNPFNSSLTISANCAASGIGIYDILGKRVRTFSDVGESRVIWDGRSDSGIPCASGVYFVRASAGERAVVSQATMLK